MWRHTFAATLSLLILFSVGGAYAHSQIEAGSVDTGSPRSAKMADVGRLSIAAERAASWTTGGPYGGYINRLAMAQTDPDVIYAGTDSGVFKTADGGETWTKTGFSDTPVWVVRVAPDSSDTVYAGSDDGIYKSEDGGSTWSHSGLFGARVNTIVVDPLDPDTLYAGTGEVGVRSESEIVGIFKSTDGGGTWELNHSDPSGDWMTGWDAVLALLFDADGSSYIYAGIVDGGFLKSTNGGETWEKKGLRDVYALAMTPAGSDPAIIYAVNDSYQISSTGVFTSTSRGESWTRAWQRDFVHLPCSVAIDPSSPNVVYLSISGGLYKSTDGGSKWSEKAQALPGTFSNILIDPRDSDVYVGLSEGGVYKSTDGAESWSSSNQGMHNTYVKGLAVHPTSSDAAFAAIMGVGDHLATTTDGGASWSYLAGSPADLGAVATDPQDPSTIFVGDDWDYYHSVCVRKSTDGGRSWTSAKLFYSSDSSRVYDIWVNPNDSTTILAAAADAGANHGGVYKSIDGGETLVRTYAFWRTITLAADPTDPDTVYAGTARNGYIVESTNGGSNWTGISPGGAWVREVRDIEVDLDSQVYAATSSGLMRWDGLDWTELDGLPTDDITALAFDGSAPPGVLYAGTGEDGVFVSRDGGSTWTPFNEGLGMLSITELAVSAGQPKVLYAGTAYGGVWSRQTTVCVFLPAVLKGTN
jgi:photosystem II stability/assembly factor-like uncharacterized protein